MNPSIAYLLIAHGSRDPRPQAAVTQLATRFSKLLQDKFKDAAQVGTAQLECAPLPLHHQIVMFGRSLPPHHRLIVLPLFLSPGVHVMEDLPAEIALAQQDLGATVQIEVRPYLGTQPGLQRLVRERMATVPMEAWILLAHGSRRSQGNQPLVDLATAVGAIPAYWSVSPSLADCLSVLIQKGCKKIGILPYFLFAGGITDAIAQNVDELAQQLPDCVLYQTPPLNASPELVNILLEMAQNGAND